MFKKFLLALGILLTVWLCPNKALALTVGLLQNNQPYTNYEKALTKKIYPKAHIKRYRTQKSLLKAIRHKKVDLALGAFNDQDLNQAFYATSTPYLYVRNILFTRQDSKYQRLSKLKGQTIGILSFESQQALAHNLHLKTKRYPSMKALNRALNQGQIKAGLVLTHTYTNYLKDHPELIEVSDSTNFRQQGQILVKIADPQVTASQFVVVGKKAALINKVDCKLNKLADRQVLAQLSQTYLGQNLTLN